MQALLKTWGRSSIPRPAETLLQEMEALGDVDEWIESTTRGYYLIEEAFASRGTKRTSEVSEEAKNQFLSYMETADPVHKAAIPWWRSLQVLVLYSAGDLDEAVALHKKLGDSFGE